MGLFDGGVRDRAQLMEELRRQGPTDVARLSEALHWPAHRTVRTLKGLGEGLRFDEGSGAVAPRAAPSASGSPARAPPAPPRSPVSAPAPVAPGNCPECHTRLTATGSAGTFFCAACGHLETPSVHPSAPRSAPASVTTKAGALDPRVAQELIAAWVTSQPIPCPNCRQTLRHHGVETYACPACGEQVTFGDSGVSAVLPPAPPAGPA